METIFSTFQSFILIQLLEKNDENYMNGVEDKRCIFLLDTSAWLKKG